MDRPVFETSVLRYATLEPGLKAAVDLLTREAQNEKAAGEIAEGKDLITDAMIHAHHFQAYQTAIELLTEQMIRLQKLTGVKDSEMWAGHTGEAG